MNREGVSIVICCHNGARRLAETLRHIACQEVSPDIPWELIIVDNKSTDRSAMIARYEWQKYNCRARFRIVLETTLGLSHARARGFREAQYEYVIMCDDDNWLAPDYVHWAYSIMTARPTVGALGGLGSLRFEVPAPGYIAAAGIFAAGEQADRPGRVKTNKIYGAGCVIRKSAYERIHALGFRSLLVDRKGRELSSGGDYELCYALAICGYQVWYDDRLRFTHFITCERLTWEYFIRYARESAQCFEVLACYKAVADGSAINRLATVHIARNFLYTLRRFVRINLQRLIATSRSDEEKMLFFRHTVLKYKLATYLGRLSQMVRIHNTIKRFRMICIADRRAASRPVQSMLESVFSLSFSKPSRQLR